VKHLHVFTGHSYGEDSGYSEDVDAVGNGSAYREIAYFSFRADLHSLKEQQCYDGED
jgi:hypothetical protein